MVVRSHQRSQRSQRFIRIPVVLTSATRMGALPLVACCTLLTALPARALDSDSASDTGVRPDRLTFDASSELVRGSSDNANGGIVSSLPAAAMTSGSVRHTLWARSGALSVGVGVEGPMGAVSNAPSPGNRLAGASVAPNLLVGVSVATSPRSTLVLDTPLPARGPDYNALYSADSGREVRLGLTIKPADPLKAIRGGQLFKVELNRRSQLAVKPGSGGLAMSYSSKF